MHLVILAEKAVPGQSIAITTQPSETTAMSVAYITHSACRRHDMGEYHPEQPARLDAINDRLIASQLMLFLQHHDAPKATREQLLRVHDQHYVDQVFELSPEEGLEWLDGDTAMNPYTLRAALHAAGAAVKAVDLVLTGSSRTAFCAVRPPGHHAERARGMGFCFFNNVAVGAAHALAEHGLQRVAIVDFDVHHGNGTEDIFSGNPQVLCCSTFQHPFYPYSGSDSHVHNIINVPLAAGTDGAAFRQAVTERWLPALHEYEPQLILISAGFDAHREDDMGQMNLLEFDYAWVTSQLVEVARRHSAGRIVSTLEGGYHLLALARSVNAHIESLMGDG